MRTQRNGNSIRPWLLLLLAVLLWGGEYLRRDLWEPDEARYAYVAREMRESGTWAVPHRYGLPYPDKPPLMFWMINLSSLVTGERINRVSARLPSLLGVMLSLWATARLGQRWFDRATGWRATMVLGTMYLFWKVGGTGQIDALLCGLQMTAIYFLLTIDRPGRRWRAAAAYACMGLAILAKGPVGFILPVLIYIAAACAGGSGRALARWHWVWGTLLALLFPVAWLLWARAEGAPASYFHEVLLRQTVSRAAGHLGHVRPAWYYLWHFPLEILPWTAFLPLAYGSLRSRSDQTEHRRQLAVWAVVVLAFFSAIASKRNLYVLLACPPCALMIASAWPYLPARRTGATATVVLSLLGLLGLVSIGSAFLPLPIARLTLVPGGLILLAGTAVLWRHFHREGFSSSWFAIFIAVLLAHQFSVATVVYPALNPLKTPGALARRARELSLTEPLLLYRIHGEILALYCGVQARQVQTVRELRREIVRQRRGIVVFDRKDWEPLWPQAPSWMTPHEFTMGSKDLVWCEFDSEAKLPEAPASETQRNTAGRL